MAINIIRPRSGSVDIDFAKEFCAGSLRALAGRIGEVLDSFYVADQLWQPSVVVARVGGYKHKPVSCDGCGRTSFADLSGLSRGAKPQVNPEVHSGTPISDTLQKSA